MRISTLGAASAVFGLAAATPTPTWSHAVDDVERSHPLAQRAAVSDKAAIGFATLNGGYALTSHIPFLET